MSLFIYNSYLAVDSFADFESLLVLKEALSTGELIFQGSNKTRQNWTGFLLVRVVTYSLRGTNRPLLIFLY